MTTDWQPPACILCECNCGIGVQVQRPPLARIRGDEAHPSRGYASDKALRLDHYQSNGPTSDLSATPPRRTEPSRR